MRHIRYSNLLNICSYHTFGAILNLDYSSLRAGENNAPKTSFELCIGLSCELLGFLASALIFAIRVLNSSSVFSSRLLAILIGLLSSQTASK